MICRNVLPQQQAKLTQAVETAFEHIPFCIALHGPAYGLYIAPCSEAVQTTGSVEEIVRIAFNVPHPLYGDLYIPFSHFR